jgi:flagellar assembly protein FliH
VVPSNTGLIKSQLAAQVVGSWNLDNSELLEKTAVAFEEPEFARVEDKEVVTALPDPEKVRAETAAAQQSLLEAQDVLEKARSEAKQILDKAQNEANAIAEHAYQKGLANAQAEMVSAIEAAKQMIDQIASIHQEVLVQSEAEVIELVKEMSKSIFGEGFTLEPQMLHDTFSATLANARSLGDLRIYVNPSDSSRLDPYWKDYQSSVSGQRILFIPSEGIRPGGCFIDGQQGTVDGRIETKLEAIMDVLSNDYSKDGR